MFEVDEQTLSDLQIFGKEKRDQSVFSIFNLTNTLGGAAKLQLLLSRPIKDRLLLEERMELICYLERVEIELDLSRESLDFIEYFLYQRSEPKPFNRYRVIKDSLDQLTGMTQEGYNRQRGIQEVLDLLKAITDFCVQLNETGLPPLLLKLKLLLEDIIADTHIATGMLSRPAVLGIAELSHCDYLIRKIKLAALKDLLELLYQLDAFAAVAKAKRKYNLCYAELKPSDIPTMKMKGLYHLFLPAAVANDATFNQEENVCFVTGVNMAGKSTFLKSVAIAVYLAHLGFPVPARYMEFSIFDGLMTTINLSDHLSEGYSHFYAEVRRVKQVAKTISASKNIIVIFDELFRGTNVKDAYDASLAIITAFSKIRNSFFIVSTHITEVAKELEQHENIGFYYLETKMVSGKPVFSYQLKKGITEERMGMWIVENEGVLEILKGCL